MKRRKLLKHLAEHGCGILREGRAHTVVYRASSGIQSSVPRHPEIKPSTVRKICSQLAIPLPSEK